MAKSSRRRGSGRSQGPSATSANAGRSGRVSGSSNAGGSGGGGTATTAATPSPRPGDGKRGFRPFGWINKLRPRAVNDVIAELRKVTWPTPGDTRYLTFVVAVVAIMVGLLLGAFDLAFGQIIEWLFFD